MSKLHLDLRPLTVGEVAEIKHTAFERLRAYAAGRGTTLMMDDQAVLRLCAMVEDLRTSDPQIEAEQPHLRADMYREKARTTTAPVNTGMTHRKVGGDAAGPLSGSTGQSVSFAEVLHVLRTESDARAWRTGWNGQNQYVQLQRRDLNSKMTEPYLFLTILRGKLKRPKRIPWLASQADLLTDDWNWKVES